MDKQADQELRKSKLKAYKDSKSSLLLAAAANRTKFALQRSADPPTAKLHKSTHATKPPQSDPNHLAQPKHKQDTKGVQKPSHSLSKTKAPNETAKALLNAPSSQKTCIADHKPQKTQMLKSNAQPQKIAVPQSKVSLLSKNAEKRTLSTFTKMAVPVITPVETSTGKDIQNQQVIKNMLDPFKKSGAVYAASQIVTASSTTRLDSAVIVTDNVNDSVIDTSGSFPFATKNDLQIVQETSKFKILSPVKPMQDYEKVNKLPKEVTLASPKLKSIMKKSSQFDQPSSRDTPKIESLALNTKLLIKNGSPLKSSLSSNSPITNEISKKPTWVSYFKSPSAQVIHTLPMVDHAVTFTGTPRKDMTDFKRQLQSLQSHTKSASKTRVGTPHKSFMENGIKSMETRLEMLRTPVPKSEVYRPSIVNFLPDSPEKQAVCIDANDDTNLGINNEVVSFSNYVPGTPYAPTFSAASTPGSVYGLVDNSFNIEMSHKSIMYEVPDLSLLSIDDPREVNDISSPILGNRFEVNDDIVLNAGDLLVAEKFEFVVHTNNSVVGAADELSDTDICEPILLIDQDYYDPIEEKYDSPVLESASFLAGNSTLTRHDPQIINDLSDSLANVDLKKVIRKEPVSKSEWKPIWNENSKVEIGVPIRESSNIEQGSRITILTPLKASKKNFLGIMF